MTSSRLWREKAVAQQLPYPQGKSKSTGDWRPASSIPKERNHVKKRNGVLY